MRVDGAEVLGIVDMIVRKYWPGARDQDREDMTQEGCVAALRAAADYRPGIGRSFESWLAQRAKWGIVDYLRSSANWWERYRRQRSNVLVKGGVVVGLRDDGEPELGIRLLENELLEFLASTGVPPRNAEFARLRYLHGMSQWDISRRFGVHDSTVSVVLSRIDKILRRARSENLRALTRHAARQFRGPRVALALSG